MTTELKRCPFCGGEASKSEANGQDKKYLTIGCINSNCPAPKMFWEFDEISLQDAIKAWNNRPLEKQARLEALQECLKVCEGIGKETLEDSTSYCVTKIQSLIDKEKVSEYFLTDGRESEIIKKTTEG